MKYLKGLITGSKQKRTIAVIIAVAVMAGAGYFAGIGSRQSVSPGRVLAAGVSLRASAEDSLGIPVDADFILSSDTALNAADIKKLFKTKPELELAVESIGGDGKQFRITSMSKLEANKVYRFELGGETWSFQTKNGFKVVRSLPADKSREVPVNSGIEITFSHDGYEDIKDYFEITPGVEGFFERHKRTAVFVPKELKPGTIYTVRLKKGLGVSGSSETLEDEYVFQFETQPLEAAGNKRRPLAVYFSKYMYEYPSGERPLLDFNFYSYDSADDNVSMTVDLYKYKDADRFIDALEEFYSIPYWASYARKAHREDTSGLEKAASFQSPIQKIGYTHYILFPESLEEGHYLADITCTDNATGETSVNQIRLQITDVSGYVSAATDKTLAWANSIGDGKPIQGAAVELKGGAAFGKTGKNGTLVFDTPVNMKDSSDGEASCIFLKLTAQGP